MTSTLVFCCGGLVALGAVVGPPSEPPAAPKPPAVAPVKPVEAVPSVSESPSESPTPSAAPTTVAPPPPVQITVAPPPVQTTDAPPPPPPAGVYYANCAAVRAAGKAPLHSWEPGYRLGLDRDHDGVACE
ncbi:excalibur calcium-binding domain-containing protein [Planosporangium mesophilum]|nr:excalibur calcium-binding domain-containing protein [Planosporangium mesophilum]